MMPRFFADIDGNYIGAFDGYEHVTVDQAGNPVVETVYPPFPEGGVEIPYGPDDARQKWDGAQFLAVPSEQP